MTNPSARAPSQRVHDRDGYFGKVQDGKQKGQQVSLITLCKSTDYVRQDEILDEVVSGIATYFEKALGNILLYRFERHQYATLKTQSPDKKLSDIYGAEHLLRLFGMFMF